MNILSVRRISQIFFFTLFLWFCAASALGEKIWQLRGWPVNWFLELDPLSGIGTLLASHTLYKGMIWGIVTVALTMILGRFFCGWICPFGTLHQVVGYIAKRKKSMAKKIQLNRFHPWQGFKYWILAFMLGAGAANLLSYIDGMSLSDPKMPWIAVTAVLLCLLILTVIADRLKRDKRLSLFLIPLGIVVVLLELFRHTALPQSSLQTGLLDPIPLFYRSVNLILLPFLDGGLQKLSAASRHYQGAGLIGAVFGAAVLLNLKAPRFYCRFVCPLGALFGLLVRYSIFRIGKITEPCSDCKGCEADCEGSCSPSSRMVWGECVLCLNCIKACRTHEIAYQARPSEGGEILVPDFAKRGFVFSIASGALAIPWLRISGAFAANWNPHLVRPPGALEEKEFLGRCIKCGQCMRICPTNVIQPAGLEGGLEGLWTPVLNFRIGSSGCQHNCIACGHLCPTAAIRPLSFDERFGKNQYDAAGPIRIGTAFIDRGRCLPWAMDKPCIVCQENCPVSPKAIFTRETFVDLHYPESVVIQESTPVSVTLGSTFMPPGGLETGDYYCAPQGDEDSKPRQIRKNTGDRIEIHPENPWLMPPLQGRILQVKIRLQQPFVNIDRCIGCGVCEHECPVSGKRAIRITAENESRHRQHALTFAPAQGRQIDR